MNGKPMKFLARLAGWEGFIGTGILLVVLALMAGCSTKWEQNVGDYKASVYWGADFEEQNKDE